MATVNAREFVEIDLSRVESETLRLESLHQKLANHPPQIKKRLVEEFLEIIEDHGDRLSVRLQACNILGGCYRELGVIDSVSVADRICGVLNDEFIAWRRPKRFALKKQPHLVAIRSPVEWSFLVALLAAMLKIDYKSVHVHVERILASAEDVKLKVVCEKILSKAKRNNL